VFVSKISRGNVERRRGRDMRDFEAPEKIGQSGVRFNDSLIRRSQERYGMDDIGFRFTVLLYRRCVPSLIIWSDADCHESRPI
jgi:hypothetical protein